MALKLLLVSFTTNRTVEVSGTEEMVSKRVRFAAKSVVDLNDDELELLDSLTVATGKLHYREPMTEGGQTITASEPVVVEVPDYAGQDVPIVNKTVDQLKAYLTFHSVEFKPGDNKADLLALAQTNEASGPAGNADLDGGL